MSTKDADFTFQQLAAFRRYEKVRAGGRFNMFDPRARQLTDLDRDEYTFVMLNYSALKEAAAAEDAQ